MNPSSIGGGRSRLPRSVRNLFTAVQLEKPSEQEVQSIAVDIFSNCLSAGLLDQQHAAGLLDFHQAAAIAAERRDLGRGGTAAEFNLRDLIKVRDILWATMKDEVHLLHLQSAVDRDEAAARQLNTVSDSWLGTIKSGFSKLAGALGLTSQKGPAASRRTASCTDLRVQVLCKVLFSVYGSRFQSKEDQERIRQLIVEHLDVQEHELVQSWDTSIECCNPTTLKIGAVFMGKGKLMDVLQSKAHSVFPSCSCFKGLNVLYLSADGHYLLLAYPDHE